MSRYSDTWTLADERRRNRELYPCKIKGCKRTAYRGSLCRGHWAMVPNADKMRAMIAVLNAQMKESSKHHRRFLRELQAKLDRSNPPRNRGEGAAVHGPTPVGSRG